MAGAMQLSQDDFWYSTPREFYARQHGFARHVREMAQQLWEVSRFNASITLQPHLKKNTKLRPADIAVFPWEAEGSPTSADGLTDEERKQRAARIIAKWDAMDAKKHPNNGEDSRP